jgi:hypothetical protein
MDGGVSRNDDIDIDETQTAKMPLLAFSLF